MIEFDGERRKWIFCAGGLFCLLFAAGLLASFSGNFSGNAGARALRADEFAAGPRVSQTEIWVVYVTGAVMNPGVYEVPEGSRVNDALKRAGGFSMHADPEAINLAAPIEDGVHIRVPERGALGGTPPNMANTPNTSNTVSMPNMSKNPWDSGPGIINRPFFGANDENSGKININTCEEADLAQLPGIGPTLSRAIVQHREQNGPFQAVEDLRNVSGIGQKRFDAILEFIVVF